MKLFLGGVYYVVLKLLITYGVLFEPCLGVIWEELILSFVALIRGDEVMRTANLAIVG